MLFRKLQTILLIVLSISLISDVAFASGDCAKYLNADFQNLRFQTKHFDLRPLSLNGNDVEASQILMHVSNEKIGDDFTVRRAINSAMRNFENFIYYPYTVLGAFEGEKLNSIFIVEKTYHPAIYYAYVNPVDINSKTWFQIRPYGPNIPAEAVEGVLCFVSDITKADGLKVPVSKNNDHMKSILESLGFIAISEKDYFDSQGTIHFCKRR